MTFTCLVLARKHQKLRIVHHKQSANQQFTNKTFVFDRNIYNLGNSNDLLRVDGGGGLPHVEPQHLPPGLEQHLHERQHEAKATDNSLCKFVSLLKNINYSNDFINYKVNKVSIGSWK